MVSLALGRGLAAADPAVPGGMASIAATTGPGAIGNVRLPQFGPRPDEVSSRLQPVEIAGPEGLTLAVETAAGWSPPQPLPVRVGLLPGRPYRLLLQGLPGRPDAELYPSLRVLAPLAAPAGQRWRFPVELVIDADDLDEASVGSHVRRAVYVSHEPEKADVLASRWFDVRPGDDCLEVAGTLGEPIAELTLGNRVPPARGGAGLFWGNRGDTPSCQPIIRPVAYRSPVVPPPVCDGGDGLQPARPTGRLGIVGLSAGDTVARYRADTGPSPTAKAAASQSKLAVSNRECVYAPRFGSVRQVVRLSEEIRPIGPGGLVADTMIASEARLQPVSTADQPVAPRAARRARTGLAVEERSGPLGVDAALQPGASEGRLKPFERTADLQLESAGRRQRLATAVGLDVPVAWTRLTSANAVINAQAADVVSAGRGTATLRVEAPGRAELTLCKRAGSDAVRIGEEIDFTIAFLNSGDVPLTDIVVVDVLPGRLELIAESPAASLPAEISTATAADGAVTLSWRLREPLDAGASGFVRFRAIVR